MIPPLRSVTAIVLLVGAAQPVAALEERFEDLSASVQVEALFGLDAADTTLSFTDLGPGETKVLGEGRPYQVTCRSNSGRPWYLKAELRSLQHTGGGGSLPAPNLQWRIISSTGAASVPSRFQEFTEQPVLIYASQGADQRGRPVTLNFHYSLTAPSSALAGTYVGHIVFTMSETP